MTIAREPERYSIESFKMPSASAAAAYELGVKIFGRDGIPTDNGLKNLLTATREELKLPADISPETVIDLSILKDANETWDSAKDLSF